MCVPRCAFLCEQRTDSYQRSYRGQTNMVPWARQVTQQRGKMMAPLGPHSPRFQQVHGSPTQRSGSGQIPWFQKARRPSEGMFPQRNPGMKSITMEEYDFDKATEEVCTLKVSTSLYMLCIIILEDRLDTTSACII